MEVVYVRYIDKSFSYTITEHALLMYAQSIQIFLFVLAQDFGVRSKSLQLLVSMWVLSGYLFYIHHMDFKLLDYPSGPNLI